MTGRGRIAAALLAVGLVVGVSPIPAHAAPGPGNAPQYWFDDWDVFGLWNSGARGQGVTIATIDTGVNADLPELRGRVLSGTDLGGSGNGHVDREVDEFGHGTAMASIMVARPGLLNITGMAPGAKVLPIAVPLTGTSDAARPDRLPEAIRYAADHGAKVISMSLGGKRDAQSDDQSCPVEEQAAVFHALRKGAMVIASVGNTGPRRNTIEEPGVCLGVVSVGSVDSSGTVAPFSARQPYLTMVAPGVDIPSLSRVAGNAYAGDGTSQSTAIVSAAAALVWSKYPRASARYVVTRLLATLDDKRREQDPAYGYGLLDAGRAVTAKVPPDAKNAVFDTAAPFLRRDTAFARVVPPSPPKPAGANRPLPDRATAVASSPRITPQVVFGVALAAFGLLALVVLGAVTFRGRRPERITTVQLESSTA